MKRLTRYLLILIMLFGISQPMAYASVNGQRVYYITLPKGGSTRPSAPPTQEEESTIYDDGYAEFGLPFNTYSAWVKFINPEGEEEVAGFVTHREPYISIEGLSGEYTVVCLPVGGDPYEGTVYI